MTVVSAAVSSNFGGAAVTMPSSSEYAVAALVSADLVSVCADEKSAEKLAALIEQDAAKEIFLKDSIFYKNKVY